MKNISSLLFFLFFCFAFPVSVHAQEIKTSALRDQFDVEYPPQGDPIGWRSEAIPNCPARVEVIEGRYHDRPGTWKEYLVLVCDFPEDIGRESWWSAEIQSKKLAHGSLWIKFTKQDEWKTIHYREPKTEEESRLFAERGLEYFTDRNITTSEQNLPHLIRLIPKELREEYMLGFIAYKNGAFEIFFLENNKETAEKIAQEINKIIRQHYRR